MLTFLLSQVFLPLVLTFGTPVDPGFPVTLANDCVDEPLLSAWSPYDEFYGTSSILVCEWEYLPTLTTMPEWAALDYFVSTLWEDGSIEVMVLMVPGSGEQDAEWFAVSYCGAPAMGCTMEWSGSLSEDPQIPHRHGR